MEFWEHTLIGLGILFLGIAGVILNGFMLYQFYKKYRTGQDNINSLLINSAISCLGICVFAFPISSTASIVNDWVFSDFWCTYYGSVALFFGFNMMLSVVTIVIDVFLSAFNSQYEMKKPMMRKLLIVWTNVCSLFFAVVPLVGWSRINYEPTNLSCTVDILHPDQGYTSYIITTFFICYILPLSVMVYFVVKGKPTNVSQEDISKQLRSLVWLIILFVIEWTPYSIEYFWPILGDPKNIPLRLSALAPLFAKIAVVSTTFIYLKDTCEPTSEMKRLDS